MNEPGGKQLRAVGKALLYRALNPTSLCHILEGGLIPAVQYGAVGIREASLLAEWRRRGRGPPVLLTTQDVAYSILLVSHWPERGHMVL